MQQFDRKEKNYNQINFPDIVCQYNKNTGGVDSHVLMLSYYRMSFRSRKYYMRLVFHLMVIVNSWNLFRSKELKQKVAYDHLTSLCEFKFALSDSLKMKNKDIVQKKRGRPSEDCVQRQFENKKSLGHVHKPLVSVDIQKDGIGHWPSFHTPRGTCKYPGCGAKKV